MEKSVVALLQPEHLELAAGFWDGRGEDLELIGEVENFVYTFRPDGRKLVLRLTHSSHRTVDLVRGELDWVAYLHGRGLNVVRPVLSSSGAFVHMVPAGDSYFIATVFEWAQGEPVHGKDSPHWTPALFRAWGRALGAMHAVTKDYLPSDATMSRPLWTEDDLVNARRYLSPQDERPHRLLADTLAWLATLPTDRDSYGLIHTDLHLGNFFVHDGELVVFDFDDATRFWFIFDIVIPIYYSLLSIPMDDAEAQSAFVREFFPHFMAGYREHNEIDPLWYATIPRFLRFRDLQLYIFCHKKFDLENLSPGQRRFLERTGGNLRLENPYAHLDFTLPI